MNEITEHFEPFPADVQQQKVQLRKPSTAVHNPHHPHNQVKTAAAGMQLTNGPAVSRIPPGGVPTSQRPASVPQMPTPMAAPVQQPVGDVPIHPNSEIEMVSFALPSNFLFYEFKDLYIKAFRGRHFAKLHAARTEESLLHMLEAVSSVIKTAQYPEGLAFELTLPDYYACLYWLRMNSFLKHGFIHRSMCRNEKHQARVDAGEIAADTLLHAETINKATLKTTMLEAVPDPEKFQLEYPGLRLVPPLMKDLAFILMNDNVDRFVARTASCIQFEGHNAPLEARMALVDDLSADDIATIGDWENAVSEYGVDEHVTWRCKTCGVEHKDQIQLESHSFFPSAA